MRILEPEIATSGPGGTGTPATDSEIVQRVRAGDRDAYAHLVERHQALLFRHMRSMGMDHDTASDLVQDSFVRAYFRLDTCAEPHHFRSWLFRICRNLALDHLRNIRQRSVPIETVDEEVRRAPSHIEPEVRSTLQTALASLSRDLREAFLLKHDAGEEVGAMIGLTASAAKMRVHRARQILAAIVSDEEGAHRL